MKMERLNDGWMRDEEHTVTTIKEVLVDDI